jgi:hypothetical protein
MQNIERHGGPYDRGAADAYYQRPACPHYFVGASYQSERVERADMTKRERELYTLGYSGQISRKEW